MNDKDGPNQIPSTVHIGVRADLANRLAELKMAAMERDLLRWTAEEDSFDEDRILADAAAAIHRSSHSRGMVAATLRQEIIQGATNS